MIENKIQLNGLNKAEIIELKSKLELGDIMVVKGNYLEYSQNDIPLTEIIVAASPVVLGAMALILRPNKRRSGKVGIKISKKDVAGNEEVTEYIY